MKSFFKFCLLAGLIIGGKLAKQPAPAAAARSVGGRVAPNAPVVLVHQVLTSEPVKPTEGRPAPAPDQPRNSGSGLIAEMF